MSAESWWRLTRRSSTYATRTGPRRCYATPRPLNFVVRRQFDVTITPNRLMMPNTVIKLIARFLMAINWPVQPGSSAKPLGGFEMVVERECFACGSSERLIAGPGNLAFCLRCTTLANADNAIAYSGLCAFCDTQIGRRIGFINRRTLTPHAMSMTSPKVPTAKKDPH